MVFLHVGAPKTGTTYLQQILRNNRGALREAGLLYPGEARRSHFWASQDLRGIAFKDYTDVNVAGAWKRLVDEIREWPARSVIDHELLAGASRDQIDAALADLDFADTHLIWTARDIARQLPAAWQERIKNKETITYRAFLDTVHAGLGSPNKAFWRMHASPAVLARWARNIPPERVHVITVPPPGGDRTLLWQRFAAVLGVDPYAYDSSPRTENTSLSAAEAAVLRTLNEFLADVDIPWPDYTRLIKHGVTSALKADPAERIELPEDAYAWASEWSKGAVEKLRGAGYDIVGDLDELVPLSRPTGADPDDLSAAVREAAALRILSAVVKLFSDAEQERRAASDAAGLLPAPRQVRAAARRVTRTVRRAGGRQLS